jgi:excisionase family DNA binding protein
MREAADRMGVSVKTISRRISSGEIAACKYGESKSSPVRIDEADLQAYIVAHKTAERKETAPLPMRPENQ